MCSKILLAVPITLPRKCCGEVTVLRLIFGVLELYYTFCFLVSPLSGQVKPPSFSFLWGTRNFNHRVEIIDCSDCWLHQIHLCCSIRIFFLNLDLHAFVTSRCFFTPCSYLWCEENEQGIFDAILRGHIDFASDPWPSISSSAKDLVKKMLRDDTKERLSAVEVLSKSNSSSIQKMTRFITL